MSAAMLPHTFFVIEQIAMLISFFQSAGKTTHRFFSFDSNKRGHILNGFYTLGKEICGNIYGSN